MKSPTIKLNTARQRTRHSTSQSTLMCSSILILLLLASVGVSSKVQAVSPPPDGGYPGANTAEGQGALFSLSSGTGNTAIGFKTLSRNTTGLHNTAVGESALFSNTIGAQNTANGSVALFSNTTGSLNLANGDAALFANTTGTSNTASGHSSLSANITGSFNTGIGDETLVDNNGDNNSANGAFALRSNTTGSNNTAVGESSLPGNTTGSNNIGIGFQVGGNVTTANNVICIGANVEGENVSDSCYIGNIFGQTSASGIPVLVNSNNRLGTITSSKRFKDDIKSMDNASEVLFALRPVAFRYKKEIDPEHRLQLGLVAEDVEQINRNLVVRDKEGKPYSVRYDQVDAMLLNEFLKEHKKVEKQQATITHLQKDFQEASAEQQRQIQLLRAQLKEQAAQIQNVRVQIEATKPASRMVLNNR